MTSFEGKLKLIFLANLDETLNLIWTGQPAGLTADVT